MNPQVVEFGGFLGLGGTEAAMARWAHRLNQRGYEMHVAAMALGLRARHINQFAPIHLIGDKCEDMSQLPVFDRQVILHMHSPGWPFVGDALTKQFKRLYGERCSVISTNIFGKLQNPEEDTWTDFRLFISWTSCVQAAQRAGRKLDLEFFRRQSVAVYPVEDPFLENSDGASRMAKPEGRMKNCELRMEEGLKQHACGLRQALGVQSGHVLFGRFSRPEPNKWTPLVLDAFLAAHKVNANIRLLLREPPSEVATELVSQKLACCHSTMDTGHESPIVILPATSDPNELAISQIACDVILHASSIGESFGYGLAEPMALGKPVIANSVPWHDQAQIELVRHGECGLIASTVPSMKSAVLRMAASSEWRMACGELARHHILSVADLETSTDRVEMAMRCAIEDVDNPYAEVDLEKARITAEYLDKHQWGHSLEESLSLRGIDAKIRLLRWQRRVRNRF